MENIRYGRLDATDEEVIAAAKRLISTTLSCSSLAAIRWFWMRRPATFPRARSSYATIARAILADNKILILDEATSSVDTRTGDADPEGHG